ncbi:peroxiredoxin [Chromatium okenii]|uniref:peroxiredoxin n=1 Tax=Chromatium okenii TaxID=61644 RepID=UPI001903B458|nr:peroxiredoxin [Chromatium okenii]MBK1640962.1 peroxiredoxin [Chromatium okenii]
MLHTGDLAPRFSLPTADMAQCSLEEFIGRGYVIIYFYPKDDTPGCTLEALEFTDLQDEFAQARTEVIAINRDSCVTHGAFRDKYGLTVHLLSDADGEVCAAYDVIREKLLYGVARQSIVRATFIIDLQGVIRHAFYDVKPKGHAAAMLELVRELAAT